MTIEIVKHFPKPEFREHQRETLVRVEEAFDAGKKVIVLNVPTGGGKSPLAVAIASAFDNAHILTTQKSLQDQYIFDFSGQLFPMKGKSNYPCAIDPEKTCAKGPCKTNKGLSCSDKEQKYYECPFYMAVAEADISKIVLHNFASFLYQTRYAQLHSPRAVMIIDECHNAERVLMDFVGFKITAGALGGYVIPQRETIQEYLDIMEDVQESIKERITHLKTAINSAQTGKAERAKLTDEQEDLEKTALKIDFFTRQSADIDNWVFNAELDDIGILKSLEIKPVFISRFAQEFLFSFGDKVVCMSATIEPVSFARSLGIEPNDIAYITCPSTFPKENRPIWKSYVGNINYKTADSLTPAIIQKVRNALAHYPYQKGIIHTNTYKITAAIKQAINDPRLIFHGNGSGVTREQAIEHHTMSPLPTVLVSPSMTEGLDLQGDLARWSIIVKIPFPYLGDKQIATRMKRDPLWYQWQAVLTMCQASGRAVRSRTDHADTFILDATFEKLLNQHRKLFPSWFLEAIR